MTRPTVLDMDLVAVPAQADVVMLRSGTEAIDEIEELMSISPGKIYDARASHCHAAMLSASPYPTAWYDVRKYVEGLERLMVCGMAELAASNPNAMEYAKHWEGRAFAAEARIAELEKRLADAERVIERVPPYLVDMYRAICNGNEMAASGFAEKDNLVGLARAYMEGK